MKSRQLLFLSFLVFVSTTTLQAQFNYTISPNLTITITGYTGLGGLVSIPDMINGLPVTSIGDSAFAGSSVTNIMIPNSVTNFGLAAFGGCNSLMAINVDLNNGYYSSAGGVLFDKIQSTLILCPHARAGDYTIPTGVTTVASGGFSNCTALSSVTLPSTITIIGDYACQGCTNLHSVTIPDSVINIGMGAFNNCSSLTNATIGNSVTNLGPAAFGGCTSLTNFRLGNSVINIPDSAFSECHSLTSVVIPNEVTNIGAYAFFDCVSLTSATIGNSVVNIGDSAFAGSGVTDVMIPNSVTNIGNQTFAHCVSLTNLTIGNSVVNIGFAAFAFCKLNSVIIPNGVIANAAFGFCSNLTTVTLGTNVTIIGSQTFEFCPALAGVYFLGSAPSGYNIPFFGSDHSIIYYLPGTMGWGPTFAGRPALPINIQIQIGDGSPGVQTNRFGFNITGSYGLAFVVESATDLANPTWSPLLTNTLTSSSFYFSDPKWTNYASRFYRVRWP